MTEHKPPGRLVLVTWWDSCGPARKWHDGETIAKEYRSLLCQSVGWILRHDKKDLIMCSSYGSSEVGDVSAIPMPCVVRIKRLRA